MSVIYEIDGINQWMRESSELTGKLANHPTNIESYSPPQSQQNPVWD